MMDSQQQAVPTAGQVSPDGQSVWNGSAWVPNPNLPKPKKKHTVRNVFLAIIALGVLFVGGCMALIGGAANEISKSIDEHENQKGGSNNPITLDVGEGFTIGDTSYAKGWTVKNDVLGSAEVKGLQVTNNGSEPDYPSVEFRFWNGKTMLAEVSCGLLEEVPAGTTQKLDCTGDEPLPAKFEKVTVQNSM
jgi:hypothetical protein